ncbi:MAG: DsbA family protein [Proteobacteria bacterium]|nr:DsbA family protein [Pseudomonadota bacterium]
MTDDKTALDFYHDAVCGWCFVLAPRIKLVAREFDLDIRHRSFVLQDSRERMIAVFGSMPAAKAEILRHWEQCRAAADDPTSINVEGMRAASFEYPNGWLAALACQAAELQTNVEGHERMFDALQVKQLTENRDIADPETIMETARHIGLDLTVFERGLAGAPVRERLQADRQEAAPGRPWLRKKIRLHPLRRLRRWPTGHQIRSSPSSTQRRA